MPRRINKYNCIGCDSCERVCKVGCIAKVEEKYLMNLYALTVELVNLYVLKSVYLQINRNLIK